MQYPTNTALFILLSLFSFISTQAQNNYRLWYDEPASIWEATLPLGNGHLGAAPDGGIQQENLVLNDITLWSGGPQEANKEDAYQALPKIRELLFAGKNDEAEALINETFVCEGKGSGYGNGPKVPYGSFQVLGNLHLHFDYGTDSLLPPENYLRQLSLDSALAFCRFKLGKTLYQREYFTAFNHNVVAVRLSATGERKLNLDIGLDRPENFETVALNEGSLQMTGQLSGTRSDNGMRFLTELQIAKTDGVTFFTENHLKVRNATNVIIYLTSATDYGGRNPEADVKNALENAMLLSYNDLQKDHIAQYQGQFQSCTLSLPKTSKDRLPTDERLAVYGEHPEEDTEFAALYFQYGRYLLLSSASGPLPPNLQGLWANTIQTPWNGDYHLNINVQMNHWPAEVTNLAAQHQPLIKLISNLTASGEKTAKAYYNGEGWVAHMMTNVWRYTAPGEQASWGSFNTGSAWLCAHLWDHYAFNPDLEYLESVYPVMKGSAQFYLSTLVKDPQSGWLVTAPSNSPENHFYLPNGQQSAICAGPTMDNQLIRELFSNVIEASKLLKKDEAFRKELEVAKAKLPPTRIGKYGQVMEWLEDYEEVDTLHRHISQLYGLYPANQITPSETPELANAARVTLNRRGDGSTGWSRAWKICFWARLGDGNHASKILTNLLTPQESKTVEGNFQGGSYPNLWCAHPPFQIDGNFGACAGIAEMLVQSHAGFIEILPALPDHWKEGSFSGLCVRGGGEVAAEWRDNQIKEMAFTAKQEKHFKVKIPEYVKGRIVLTIDSEQPVLTTGKEMLEFTLQKGQMAMVTF